MNKDYITKLSEQVLDVASRARPPQNIPPDTAELLFKDGKGYSLSQVAIDQVNRIIETALGVWSDKFSEEYIRKRINEAISLTIKRRDSTAANEILTLLASEFQALQQEHIVYLPVFGLSLPMGELHIGNVIIYPMDSKKKHVILETFISAVKKTSSPPAEQDAVIAQLRISIEKAFKAHSIAEYRIIAEPKRAIERAEEEVRRALEALRFAIPFLSAPERKIAIGLPDDAFRIITSAFAVSDSSFNITTSVVSGLMPFEISPECYKNLKDIGVFTLSELLQRSGSSLSDYEKSLLSSVHWFSTAQLQPEIESSYLALITSIEVLLTPRDSSPIATAIAEALALILRDKLEDRLYIKRLFKELYSKRSAVSHGGDKAILDSDHQALLHIAMTLIHRLIARRKEFTSRSDLLQYIEKIKLSYVPGVAV